jgi:predicted nucleotidyltransferase
MLVSGSTALLCETVGAREVAVSTGLELDEDTIAALCRRFGVRRLSVFGSAVTGSFDPERSDVDFLVEFDPDAEGLFDSYFGLKEELEQLVGRPVDLVMAKSLENPYFAATVKRSRRDLYAP